MDKAVAEVLAGGGRRWACVASDAVEFLKGLPDGCVNCCVTSPPYFGLRDYGHAGQIGLEPTPAEFVARLLEVFRQVRRVLRDDGTCWVNLGDSYSAGGRGTYDTTSANKGTNGTPRPPRTRGSVLPAGFHERQREAGAVGRAWVPPPDGFKPKDRLMIPARFAIAAHEDGWYLRDEIVWHKPNPMPESVTDRCTKAHEMIYLLTKSERYHFDADAIKEPAAYAGQMRGGSSRRYEQNAAGMDNRVYDTRNKRSVWTVNPQPYKHAHFATYPPDLVRPCLLAGCPVAGVVLDPFSGSGTTGDVAVDLGLRYVGCDLNPEYVALAHRRLSEVTPDLFAGAT